MIISSDITSNINRLNKVCADFGQNRFGWRVEYADNIK